MTPRLFTSGAEHTVNTLPSARKAKAGPPAPFSSSRHQVPTLGGMTEDTAEVGRLGPCPCEASCEPRSLLKCFPQKEK